MISAESLAKLSDLVRRLELHEGPWGEWKGGEKTDNGAIQMPYSVDAPVVSEAKQFLYDNDLVITFDWPNWQEGRDFFTSDDPQKFEKLDEETVLKLLSAIIRNARFNEGAWVNLFESGDGLRLFKRLLEIQD